MNAILEMDRSGRVVIPKRLRDKLHLHAGSRLTLSLKDQTMLLAADKPSGHLREERGWLVYDHGHPLPPEHLEWVAINREEDLDQ